ncbi:hypothetical protein Q8F55_000053 [Vanrija albida]|uniref:F-box domain-containing protein n=1 Tax=Vanrija albida TaxID=181172 RepID=A0ABR3QC62_9TREE
MPAVIAHTAYPHVITRILEHASIETRFAFRLTSRTYHYRVNQLLLEHACLDFIPLADLSDLPPPPVGGYHSPPVEAILTSVSAPKRRLPFIPEWVGTLDLVASASAADHVGLFTHVHTIRRRNALSCWIDYYWPHPAVIVDYIDATDLTDGLSWLTPAPCETTHHVLHLKYCPALHERDLRAIATLPNFSTPHTLVLWPDCTGTTQPQLDPKIVFAIMVTYFSLWTPSKPGPSMTIVGLEKQLAEAGTTLHPNDFWEQVAASVPASKHRQAPSFFGDQAPLRTALEQGTRFLTREQWWQELGGRKEVVGVWAAV